MLALAALLSSVVILVDKDSLFRAYHAQSFGRLRSVAAIFNIETPFNDGASIRISSSSI